MLILRDSSDWHLCFSRKMSIYYELISLPEKRKSGILDAYRWIFKTAQKGMNHMHNLRKTIRYGILSILGVIGDLHEVRHKNGNGSNHSPDGGNPKPIRKAGWQP